MLSGANGSAKVDGPRKDPFGGTGPVADGASWASVSIRQIGDDRVRQVPNPSGVLSFDQRTGQAVEDSYKEQTLHVGRIQAYEGMVRHFSRRGVRMALPEEVGRPILNAIASSRRSFRKGWWLRRRVDLEAVGEVPNDAIATSLLNLGKVSGYPKIATLLDAVVKGMMLDPQSVVVWHIFSGGASIYVDDGSGEQGLIPNFRTLVDAVGKSELHREGWRGRKRVWRTDVEGVGTVLYGTVMEHLEALAAVNRHPPVDVFLDAVVDGLKGEAVDSDRGVGGGGSSGGGRRYSWAEMQPRDERGTAVPAGIWKVMGSVGQPAADLVAGGVTSMGRMYLPAAGSAIGVVGM